MSAAPRAAALTAMPPCRIVAIDVAERRWRMRLPFHYGVVTLHEADEIHLAVTLEIDGCGRRIGYSAELAAPKWFNKDPGLEAAATVERLRQAVAAVVRLAASGARDSFAAIMAALDDAAAHDAGIAQAGLNGLEISYALALVERAAIDALCRGLGMSFPAFVAADGPGLRDAWPHRDFDIAAWLASRTPRAAIAVRHTVGLSDPLTRADGAAASIGGRPVALVDVIAADAPRHFKIKFAGGEGELARLRRLSRILTDHCPDFAVSLDANEAFTDVAVFAGVLRDFAADPDLAALWSRIRYIEQPFDRSIALARDVRPLSALKPLLIDESDDRAGAFPDALACGYQGVSIKTCKGVRRALVNAALAAREVARGGTAFISAEDLSVQPGIALQQNLALAATLGLADAERNGHHFGPGPAALPADERAEFLARHGDVYAADHIVITDGRISAASAIAAQGFGTGVTPRPGATGQDR